MTPTQRKAIEYAIEALKQTSEYLLIEVNEARARDANINTIYDWEDKLSKHHGAIAALKSALAEPAPEQASGQIPIKQMSADERHMRMVEIARPAMQEYAAKRNGNPIRPARTAPLLTDEELKHLLSQSDLLDMFRHIGWYSAPEAGFRKHGTTLIRDIESLVLQKAGL